MLLNILKLYFFSMMVAGMAVFLLEKIFNIKITFKIFVCLLILLAIALVSLIATFIYLSQR